MTTTIDQLGIVEPRLGPFGDTENQYAAQTFRAAGSALNSIEFAIDARIGPDATEYRLLVTTVVFNGTGFHPGTVLFESPLLVESFDGDHSFHSVAVNTGHLALTPGALYAFVLDFFVAYDGVASVADIGMSHFFNLGTDYTDGYLAHPSFGGGDRAGHFANDWTEETNEDLSFRLTFDEPPPPPPPEPPPPTLPPPPPPPGVTITGTKTKDLVDATHTVSGQPLPTPNDDVISGGANKDSLSGLAGNDVIDGGRNKDTLFGGEGFDSFIFSVSPKREAPDNVLDFVAADDTIVLAQVKFKKLALGVLTEAAFRNVGEAATDADRIICKANGKVLYDEDGKGGADADPIVKLVGAPDIGAVDFLVI